MALALSTQPLNSSGQFSAFTAGLALTGSTYYPAVATLTAAGAIFDPATLATASGLTTINTTLGTPAQDGADATGISPLTGAAGIRGWLSSIYNVAQQPVPAAVTTNAPTYTTGTTAALSLTTTGDLRINPRVATASSPPTFTTGTQNSLQSDLQGNLRVGNGTFVYTPNGGVNVANSSHAAGAVLGTRGTNVTQPLQFLKTPDGGLLTYVLVTSTQVETIGLKAYVFGSFPSTSFTEGSVPSLIAADIPLLIGDFTMNAADSGLGTMTMWSSPVGLAIPMFNMTAFYMIFITTGATFTPAANSIGVVAMGTV